MNKNIIQTGNEELTIEETLYADLGTYIRYRNTKGNLHNPIGPAVLNDFRNLWLLDGLRSRENGPADISKNPHQDKLFYIKGKRIK